MSEVEQLPSFAEMPECSQTSGASALPAPAGQGWLCVDAPDEDAALGLVEILEGFHAELAPATGPGCQVRVELDHVGDLRLAKALGRIEGWLAEQGIATASVRLDGRCYLLEGRVA